MKQKRTQQELEALAAQAADRAREVRELDEQELEAVAGGGLTVPVGGIRLERPILERPFINGKFPNLEVLQGGFQSY
ncbi:MAG TPA: hypothetical protein VFX59_13795 [Polyangiales bacterium]|nr:hypothetical protein [Polyangiales bacterium]